MTKIYDFPLEIVNTYQSCQYSIDFSPVLASNLFFREPDMWSSWGIPVLVILSSWRTAVEMALFKKYLRYGLKDPQSLPYFDKILSLANRGSLNPKKPLFKFSLAKQVKVGIFQKGVLLRSFHGISPIPPHILGGKQVKKVVRKIGQRGQ